MEISVAEIAEAAGVGVGTVVRSFGGKQELLDSAVAEILRPVVERARRVVHGVEGAPALAEMMFELAMFHHEGRIPGAACASNDMPRSNALQAELLASFTQIVQRAQQAGSVRPDITMDDVLLLLAGIESAAERARGSREQLRRYIMILVDGLRPAHASKLPSMARKR